MKKKAKAAKIKPCPFCGREPLIEMNYGFEFISCSNNRCIARSMVSHFWTKAAAIAAWNKREETK